MVANEQLTTPEHIGMTPPYNGFPLEGKGSIGDAEISFLMTGLRQKKDIKPNMCERLAYTLGLFMDQCGHQSGLNVLDVGCNTGIFTKAIARAGNFVTGIDIDQKKIQIAQAEIKKLGNHIRFAVADATKDLGGIAASESMDVCVCTEVLEHVPDYHSALDQMMTAIKPEGLFILTVPRDGMVHDPGHIHIFTQDSLKRDLAPYGEVVFHSPPKEVDHLDRWLYATVRKNNLTKARQCYRDGKHKEALQQAKKYLSLHPESAGAWIVSGDALRQTGAYQQAQDAYTHAIAQLQSQPDSLQKKDATVAVSKRLLSVALVHGDYATVNEQKALLIELGDKKMLETIRKNQDAIIKQARNAFAYRKYEQSAQFAKDFLINTGIPNTEIELLLANSLTMIGTDVNIKNLLDAYHIAKRITQGNPTAPAWTILGTASELIYAHPKKIQLADTILDTQTDLMAIRAYKEALDIDLTNPIANQRYKELTGREYNEKFWITYRNEGYVPSSYLPSSPRLNEPTKGQCGRLDQTEELNWYWNQHGKTYQKFINEFVDTIHTPMHPQCRISVCVPAFMEGENIYRSLEHYTKQIDIDPDQFEVIVLENHPDSPNYRRDTTATEIARFKKDYPSMHVHPVYYAFPQNAKAMGNIRKTVNDIAVRRVLLRGGSNVILASHDADSYGLVPGAFRYAIDVFDKNPDLDLASGKLEYPKEAFKKFPTLHVVFRFIKSLGDMEENYVGRMYPSSSGAGTYFQAKMYAAIGGADFKVERGSDSEISRRMAYYRGGYSQKRIMLTDKLLFYTDPRRALSKMVVGLHHVDQWKDTKWQEDPRVFGKSWRDYQEPTLTSLNQQRIQDELNAYLDKRIVPNGNSRKGKRQRYMINQIMSELGIKYHFEGKILIVDDVGTVSGFLARDLENMSN